MMNALIGGITLLAILLAFINFGTPLGAVCSAISMIGLGLGIRNLRAHQRTAPTERTNITR